MPAHLPGTQPRMAQMPTGDHPARIANGSRARPVAVLSQNLLHQRVRDSRIVEPPQRVLQIAKALQKFVGRPLRKQRPEKVEPVSELLQLDAQLVPHVAGASGAADPVTCY